MIDERKKSKQPFTEVEIQKIALQLFETLNYMHKENFVHRDLKPANILMKSKQDLDIKLTDFGFAKCITEKEK